MHKNFFYQIRKYAWVLSIILSAVTLGLSLYNLKLLREKATPISGTPNSTTDPLAEKFVESLQGNEPVLGDKNAKVTIFEFADFQCPYCKRFFDASLPEIKRDYLDTGKAKLIFINLAFLGKESVEAAEAARCASDQNQFWQYHDLLYRRQGPENTGAFSKDKLQANAKDLNLDLNQFEACINSHKYLQSIQDETLRARDYGVAGTPTFFIKNQVIRGAQPASVIKRALENALR